MKYILSIATGVLIFGGTVSAAPLTVCGNNYHFEVVTDPITLVISSVQVFDGFLSCDVPDPMKVTQAWNLDGYHTPMIKAGETIVDAWGFKDTCPIWYRTTFNGNACFDISNTDYYKGLMTKAFGPR